jgi:2-(1,2-epoxy-1,2-dihydrophenyl)acetyl-CoA isomerase
MGNTVLYETKDGVAIITLNRPDKLNSINLQCGLDLQECLEKARDDRRVRSIILTGAGRAFCAGADLSIVQAIEQHKSKLKMGEAIDILVQVSEISRLVYEMEKPVIAAVNGAAMGGGASLALLCDVVFASDNAVFGFVFSKIGLAPDTGATYTLPRHLGLKKTMELFFSGETIVAEKALELGLINRVVVADGFWQVVWSYAIELASGPTLAFACMKKMVRENLSASFFEAIAKETLLQYKAVNSKDFREGIKGFFEKKKPRFLGE